MPVDKHLGMRDYLSWGDKSVLFLKCIPPELLSAASLDCDSRLCSCEGRLCIFRWRQSFYLLKPCIHTGPTKICGNVCVQVVEAAVVGSVGDGGGWWGMVTFCALFI